MKTTPYGKPGDNAVLAEVANAADYAVGSKHTIGANVHIVAGILDKTHVVLSVSGEMPSIGARAFTALQRGGSEPSGAHNPDAAGSTPAPATAPVAAEVPKKSGKR